MLQKPSHSHILKGIFISFSFMDMLLLHAMFGFRKGLVSLLSPFTLYFYQPTSIAPSPFACQPVA